MAITKFRPEIWSAALLEPLHQNLIYSAFTNRDYEGEIAEAGDTVRITSIGRPTIWTYTPNTAIPAPEQVNDSQRTLVVDQAKGFNFAVDDVDARQAKGNVIPTALTEAAFGIANLVDLYLSSFYTSIQTANQVGAVSVSRASANQAYDNVIVPLRVKLDQANVSQQNRSLAISPDLYGVLLRDSRFIKVNESGTSDGLRNGVVGRAAGFDILVSNQTPTTGSDSVVIAGNDRAITYAEQINKVEAYRPQTTFADAIKGLVLFGAKVIRPDSLASVNVTVTA